MPNSFHELMGLARRAEENGDLTAAVELLREATEAEPQQVVAWMLLASYQDDAGDLQSAITSAMKAVDIAPDPGAGGSRSPARLLGRLLSNARRYEEAIENFRKCLASDTDGGAHIFLGFALRCLNRNPEGEEAYRRALEINPRNEEAMYNLAVCLRGSDPDRAMQLLRQAIEIDPEYACAIRELGRGYYSHLADSEEAERLLRKALSLHEADYWTHAYIAYVMADWHQWAEAEKHWVRAAELSPETATPYLELGLVYQNVRRFADAEQALRRALVLDSRDTEVLYHLGWFLVDMKRQEEAKPYLEEALNLKPPAHRESQIRELLQKLQS